MERAFPIRNNFFVDNLYGSVGNHIVVKSREMQDILQRKEDKSNF